MQDHGAGQPPGAVVVRARHSATIVFGLLTAVWVACLITSESSQPSGSGRVEAGVFFVLLIALTVGGWFMLNRGRRQLEVDRGAIVSRPGLNKPPFTLARDDGDTLRILPRFKLYGTAKAPQLVFLGTGGFIALGGFPLDKVRRACEARAWRFDGDSSLAVRDAQVWLHLGRTVEAAQLIELFGPFPATAAHGQKHAGLAAAVFEDIGDKVDRGSRANARDAYRRAATAQRAFAGHAQSPDETAARMAEADRIDAKARG